MVRLRYWDQADMIPSRIDVIVGTYVIRVTSHVSLVSRLNIANRFG